jgi:hypothetical protein
MDLMSFSVRTLHGRIHFNIRIVIYFKHAVSAHTRILLPGIKCKVIMH